MSKSYGNTIALMAGPDAVKDAIRRIVTDSTPPDQPKDPDACTLVALLRVFGSDATVQAVETRYRAGTIGYGETKALLADVIEQHLAPLRDRYERLRTSRPCSTHDSSRANGTLPGAPTGCSPARWQPWGCSRLPLTRLGDGKRLDRLSASRVRLEIAASRNVTRTLRRSRYSFAWRPARAEGGQLAIVA